MDGMECKMWSVSMPRVVRDAGLIYTICSSFLPLLLVGRVSAASFFPRVRGSSEVDYAQHIGSDWEDE